MSDVVSGKFSKLSDSEVNRVAGGQLCADDVLGVKGLWVCTGGPTENNPDGYFWRMNHVYVTREEAMEIIKSKATRSFNDEDEFLEGYIDKYNQERAGEHIGG